MVYLILTWLSINCLLGSPDDPKELGGLQNLAAGGLSQAEMHAAAGGGGAHHQQMLAKPVPMRRLSEKRIAQARACLSNMPLGVDAVAMEPAYSEYHPASLLIVATTPTPLSKTYSVIGPTALCLG